MLPIFTMKVVAESATKRNTRPLKDVEWVRFFFHGLGISTCGILAPIVPDWLALALLEAALCGAVAFEVLRNMRPRGCLLGWMARLAKTIQVRPTEEGTRTSGTDFVVGLALVWTFCPVWVTSTACFITAWADPIARVIGKWLGQTKWWFSEKTLAGSVACMYAAMLIALAALSWRDPYNSLIGPRAVAVGVAVMFAELLPQYPRRPKPGDLLSPADNFSIIIVSAAMLVLLQ